MKKAIFTILVGLTTFAVIAQNNQQLSYNDLKVFSKKLIKHHVPKETKKTRAIQQRLIVDSTFYVNDLNPGTYYNSNRNNYTYIDSNHGGTQFSGEFGYYVDGYYSLIENFQYDINTNTYSKFEYLVSYDSIDRYTQVLYLQLDTLTNVFDSVFKYVTSYPTSSSSHSIYYQMVAGNWVLDGQGFSYKGINNLDSLELEQNYISTTMTFRNDSKTIYNYVANNLDWQESYKWVLSSGTWKPSGKQTFTYNSLNKKIEQIYFSSYQVATSTYLGKYTSTYFYDTQNRLDSIYNNSLFDTTSSDAGGMKYGYAGSDTNFNKIASYLPASSGTISDLMIFEFDVNDHITQVKNFVFNPTTNAWDSLSNYTKYYYENYNTSVGIEEAKSVHGLSIFPNPASNHTYVSYFNEKAIETQIEISNLMGELVYRTTEKGSIGDHLIKLPTDKLPQGIYIISLISNHKMQQNIKLLTQ